MKLLKEINVKSKKMINYKIFKIAKSKHSNSRLESVFNFLRLPNPKCSQHEIAGFVLIVVIVSIIGLIFLSFMFGSGEINEQTSVEVSHLLGAIMYVTTDCAINYIPQYREMQDLIKDCYKDQSLDYRDCLDGRDVCKVLEQELKEVIEKGLEIREDAPNKAYSLDVYYSPRDETIAREDILLLKKGSFMNCSSIVGGGHFLPVSSLGGGNIDVTLRVCKGK